MRTRPLTVAGLLAASALASGGCVDGLAVRQDTRLTMTAPTDRATVALPVTVAWDDTGIRPHRWAVLLDRNPPPHGKPLTWLGEDRRGISETADRSVTLEIIPTRGGVAPAQRDTHEVIVVPMDAAGRRIGESFAKVEFTVARPG